MSFDKATRNALARIVGACRALLTEDVRNQLQQVYGFQPDGTVLPLDRLGHLDDQGRETAAALRQWLEHLAAVEIGTEAKRRAAAFERMAHETAFTVLNRLAALRAGAGHRMRPPRHGIGRLRHVRAPDRRSPRRPGAGVSGLS